MLDEFWAGAVMPAFPLLVLPISPPLQTATAKKPGRFGPGCGGLTPELQTHFAGFQFFTKSRHWVISGTLVSQLCSYSQCSGPG